MRAGRLALAVIGLYLVLVGGTELGRLYPELRAVNGILAGFVITAAIARRWPGPDLVAMATILAVAGFTAAALVSPLPRYALDAALSAIGYGAAFLLLRGALADGATYVWARQLLAVVALAFIATFAVLWLSVWASWLSATGFSLWPPLTLPLPTIFFRHAHVVAFTAILLLPAVWAHPGTMLGHAARVSGTLATLFLVVASGSRTVLFAALIATVAVYGLRWRSRVRLTPRMAIGGGLAAVLVIVAIVLIGSGGFLLQRLLTISTLAARGEIWGATIAGWLDRPLFGFGPGTYSLALPWTGYFDENVFSPRHADNALIQLLFEAGAVGVALVLPLVALMLRRALLAAGRTEARWAILFFALGSITDNPTDTVGLIALLIFWAAAVAPADAREAAPAVVERRSLVRVPAVIAVGVIALAWSSITVADFSYAAARRSAAAGNQAETARQLTQAATFDPSNAFYRRQLGLLHAVTGELGAAAHDLEVALELNRADDVTSRDLGLVYLELGREDDADRLTSGAVDLRASDAVNQLIRVRVQLDRGEEAGARVSAARVVELGHWMVAADGWEEFLAPVPSAEVVRMTLAKAEGDGETTYGVLTELAWLLGLVGQGADAAQLAAQKGDPTAEAIGLMFECRLDEAAEVLNAGVRRDGSLSYYWLVRYMIESLAGSDTTLTERVLALFSQGDDSAWRGADEPGPISPQSDELRDSHLYHRLPMPAVEGPWAFPNARSGFIRWLRDPALAASIAAPRSRLAECAGR